MFEIKGILNKLIYKTSLYNLFCAYFYKYLPITYLLIIIVILIF